MGKIILILIILTSLVIFLVSAYLFYIISTITKISSIDNIEPVPEISDWFKGETPSIKKPPIEETPIEKEEPLEIKVVPEVTLIDIPLDWQDYALSCEAASLKMALAGKGIYVSESEIMQEIGFDITPRNGDIWGDPYEAFVGYLDGEMCSTGFGVFWEPVAKAANKWRPSEAFSNWNLPKLVEELEKGNLVIMWGNIPTKSLTDCSWHTPEGRYIEAYYETHVRLVVGFTGPSENPSHLILNDPLTGRLYWSPSDFFTNWKTFGFSGVVVR